MKIKIKYNKIMCSARANHLTGPLVDFCSLRLKTESRCAGKSFEKYFKQKQSKTDHMMIRYFKSKVTILYIRKETLSRRFLRAISTSSSCRNYDFRRHDSSRFVL